MSMSIISMKLLYINYHYKYIINKLSLFSVCVCACVCIYTYICLGFDCTGTKRICGSRRISWSESKTLESLIMIRFSSFSFYISYGCIALFLSCLKQPMLWIHFFVSSSISVHYFSIPSISFLFILYIKNKTKATVTASSVSCST